jgi:hypothetical protein
MVRTGAVAMAVAALAAAGCVQAPLAALPAAPVPAAAQAFTDAHDGCTGYLLAILLDPARTDPYLPPGFHLRDAKDFVRGVATGQALLLVLANLCAPTASQPQWGDATAAVYVQPPAVEGDRPPADYDLYEVEHYSPEPALQAHLRAWEWPATNVSLEDASAVRELHESAFSFAAGRQPSPVAALPQDGGALFRFGGATPVPHAAAPFTPAVARVWRDTPLGLAHLDYSLSLSTDLGSGTCTFQAGSLLAQVTGSTACGLPDSATGAPEPNLVGTFATSFRAAGVLQPGVRAQ